MAALMVALLHRRGDGGTPAVRQPRALLALALLPSAVALAYEWATGDPSANWIRASAGLPIGAAVAVLIGTLR
jgi:hypothetical protein